MIPSMQTSNPTEVDLYPSTTVLTLAEILEMILSYAAENIYSSSNASTRHDKRSPGRLLSCKEAVPHI